MIIYNKILHVFPGFHRWRETYVWAYPYFQRIQPSFQFRSFWDWLAIFVQEDRIRYPEPKDCILFIFMFVIYQRLEPDACKILLVPPGTDCTFGCKSYTGILLNKLEQHSATWHDSCVKSTGEVFIYNFVSLCKSILYAAILNILRSNRAKLVEKYTLSLGLGYFLCFPLKFEFIILHFSVFNLTFWYFPLHHTSSLWRSSDFPNFPCINILSNLSYLMLFMTPLPNGPIFSCSNQSFKKIQTLNPLASLISI